MKETPKDVFDGIYAEGHWGDEVRSGFGSQPEQNQEYIQVLQQVLARDDVQTVADLGCGDWAFSRLVDFSGVQYTGYDVVPSLIEHHNQTFGSEDGETLCFKQLDFLNDKLPKADLIICKDVLQHWPTSAIHVFLDKLGDRKALLTNDWDYYKLKPVIGRWPRTAQNINASIELGQWRCVRLLDPPFELKGKSLAKLKMSDGEQVWIKEALLVGT